MIIALIQKMSGSEKRHFKIFTQQYRIDSKYVKLFDLIEKELKNEEKSIKEIEKKFNKKDISTTKNYLCKILMRSLRIYYAKDSKRIQMQELMSDAYILKSKGLWKESLKYIKKAKKIANKYHYDIYLLELSFLERKLIRHIVKNNIILEKKIETINTKTELELKAINEEVEIGKQYDKIYIQLRKREKIEKDQSIEAKFIVWEEINLSFNSKAYLELMQSMYYGLLKNKKQSNDHLKKLVVLFEKEETIIKTDNDYFLRYLGILNNYFISSYRLRDKPIQLEIIEKFNKITSKEFILQAQVFQLKFNIFLIFYLSQQDYKTIIQKIPEIEIELEKYGTNIPQQVRLTFFNNIAIALLLEQEQEQALSFINRILNNSRREIRDDIFVSAKMLELLIHYDLKHQILVINIIPLFKRILREIKPSNISSLLLVVQAIQLSITTVSQTPFLVLENRLEEITDIEIKIWIEQKIQSSHKKR